MDWHGAADFTPGSDGIPYSVYKKLWVIAGPFILDAWNYSCNIGVYPLSQRESIIVIFPKDGKDQGKALLSNALKMAFIMTA